MRLGQLMSATIVLLPFACKSPPSDPRHGFILGPSNDIKVYDPKTEDISDAGAVLIITKLSNGDQRLCSGEVIENPYDAAIMKYHVLTNHHCFASSIQRGQVSKGTLKEACVETTVYQGVTLNHKTPPPKFTCKIGTLMGDHVADLALFEIEGDEKDLMKLKKTKLAESTESFENPRDVYIVHYPNVKENYTIIKSDSIQVPATAISSNDCKTAGYFEENELYMDASLPYAIRHTCDLVDGSSGSALIDEKTGLLIGTNWGGIEISSKNAHSVINAATSIKYIHEFLQGERQQALALNSKSSQKKNEAKLSIANGCGTIGREMSGSVAAILSLLFLLPLIWVKRKFQL